MENHPEHRSHKSTPEKERGGHRHVKTNKGQLGHATKEEAKMIGQWKIGRTIGKGSSGRVKIAKHVITGKYAAIKIVPKGLILTSRMSMSEAGARADKILLGIEREIVIMKLIDHPNVLNLYDVWETSGELFLIMEYVPGGELFDYLVKRGRLPQNEALHYFQQIVHAVDYCHRFNICHRDLKPENLLLDKDKNIKVADFGMAAWQAGERMLETSCGSPHYASPEIVAGKAYDGSASDIWSCGIILFALITGRLPFDDDNIRVLLMKVKTGVFEMPHEVQGSVRDLLFRMLEKDPAKRITMPEILAHPFFTSLPPHQIPGRPLVAPPSLEEVERPVESADEIDPDIMGNLKTLWNGASEEEIIEALLSPERTWEKALYHLLVKYRNRHLENYNQDEESQSRPVQRTSKHQEKALPHPVVAVREPLRENIQSRSTANRTSYGGEEPPRPQAPTPTKAQGKMAENNKVMTSPTVQERIIQNPNNHHLRSMPQGPRPPLTPRITPPARPVRTESVDSRPNSELGVLSVRNSQLSSQDHPAAASIQAPTVDNSDVQKFFEEVASQLNSMGARFSVTSESSQQAYQTTTSPELLGEAGDTSRFADAEDDESDQFATGGGGAPYTPLADNDAFSVHSIIMSGGTPGMQSDHWGYSSVPPTPQLEQQQQQQQQNRRTSVRSGNRRSGAWAENNNAADDYRGEVAATMTAHRVAPQPPQQQPQQQQQQQLQRPPPPSLPRDNSYVYVELDEETKSYDWTNTRTARRQGTGHRRWNDASKSKKKFVLFLDRYFWN